MDFTSPANLSPVAKVHEAGVFEQRQKSPRGVLAGKPSFELQLVRGFYADSAFVKLSYCCFNHKHGNRLHDKVCIKIAGVTLIALGFLYQLMTLNKAQAIPADPGHPHV